MSDGDDPFAAFEGDAAPAADTNEAVADDPFGGADDTAAAEPAAEVAATEAEAPVEAAADEDPFGLGGGDDAAPAADAAAAAEDPFGMADADAEAEPLSLGEEAKPAVVKNADPFAYVPPANDSNSALRQWEAKREAELQQRRTDAEAKQAAEAAEAKQTVKQFYADREERVNKQKTQNRADEKDAKADLASVMASGTIWQKVGKLVELAPKQNDKRPVARMRTLLIQLKNDPAAPGNQA